jgi:hypothetical protein
MTADHVQLLTPEKTRHLVEMAERARADLSRLSEQDLSYDATALQQLDEWIERVQRRTPTPPPELRALWMVLLGEVFRRRHGGEWATIKGDKERLAVLCPTEGGELHAVEVAEQVRRRIVNGFADSLALFYLQQSVLLHQREEL